MLRTALLPMIALALGAQDFSEIVIEKALTAGYRFTNGPAWSKEGYLLFSDQPRNRIIHWTPGRQPQIFLEDAQGASGLAFDAQGRLFVCQGRARRVIRIDQKKHIQPVAERYQGKRLNAPNDVIVRRDGNVYFTDPAFGYQEDNRELGFYGVYRVTPKGEVDLIAKSASRPNGVGLSPNGRTLYVSDSDRRTLRAYDLDRGGAASNERTFASGIEGVPRGLCVDEKNNVYVAARHLEVFNAEGKSLRRIELGELPPSNCAFGDGDLMSLYVTAGPSVFRIRLNVKGAFQY
jgi:gluconolactonase